VPVHCSGSCVAELMKTTRRGRDSRPNWTSVHEPECQLVNHVALVQLDSVDAEPMDACNALTAPSEGLRRNHVNDRSVHAQP
jgi:hypothetical protein